MAEQKQIKKDAQEGEVIHEASEEVKKPTPWPIITVSVFAVVMLLALVVWGWLVASSALHKLTSERTSGEIGRQLEREYMQRGGERGYGGMWESMTPAASGVIVKIEGDMITVAGQGKQVAVVRTDDTRITGDKTELAVNDTVVVRGDTEDDGTVVADRIVVRNEAKELQDSRPRRTVPNA